MVTKQEERETLEKIRSLVESLGEDSYLGAAFEGCFEIAEQNIENDWACSMKQKAESLEAEKDVFMKSIARQEKEHKRLQQEIVALKAAYEREQEWEPQPSALGEMPQEEYQDLLDDRFTKHYNDEEAKKLLNEWFGFEKERITIIHEIWEMEKNRHGLLRRKSKVARFPLYNSSDWNYFRFDCASVSYELVNGDLHFFTC